MASEITLKAGVKCIKKLATVILSLAPLFLQKLDAILEQGYLVSSIEATGEGLKVSYFRHFLSDCDVTRHKQNLKRHKVDFSDIRRTFNVR